MTVWVDELLFVIDELLMVCGELVALEDDEPVSSSSSSVVTHPPSISASKIAVRVVLNTIAISSISFIYNRKYTIFKHLKLLNNIIKLSISSAKVNIYKE